MFTADIVEQGLSSDSISRKASANPWKTCGRGFGKVDFFVETHSGEGMRHCEASVESVQHHAENPRMRLWKRSGFMRKLVA